MRGPGHAIPPPPGPVSSRHAVQGSPARREWSIAVPSSKHLEQSRRSHSAADTHCHHDVPGATPFPLDQGMADHTRTGHAVGMPNRDGAAADVESFDGNTEAILAIEHLHRKGDRKSTRLNSSH